MPVPPPEHASRALVGVGLLAVVVAGLHLLGHAALAPPVLTEPSTWATWATSRSPILVAMAVVRLVAIGLAWYLLAATLLQLAAGLTSSNFLATVVRLVTTSTSRHVTTAVLGVGVMATTPLVSPVGRTVPAVAAPGPTPTATDGTAPASPAASPPTLRRATADPPRPLDPGPHAPGPGAGGRAEGTPPRLVRQEPPLLDRLEPTPGAEPEPATPTEAPSTGAPDPITPGTDSSVSPPAPTTSPPGTPVPTAPDQPGTGRSEDTDPGTNGVGNDVPEGLGDDQSPGDPTSEPSPPHDDRSSTGDGTWTVVAGDHFWGVAEREVARRLGRTPDEEEVASWWRELVTINRDRLVDPGNPDLILPGQVMRYPPPTTEAG